MTRDKFGKLLREQREEAKRSMGELARHLGVSVPYLSDVERGNRPPLVNEKIEKAASFLNVEAEPLVRAAAETRGAFHLDARGSGEARQVGAMLARQWPTLSDEKLKRLREVLEED